jgi:hypothetical protein
LPFAIVNRVPGPLIFCDHDLACFVFLALAWIISGLLLGARALALRCRPCS